MADPINITIFVERNKNRLAAVPERNWESLDVIFSRISNIEDRQRLLPQRRSPIWVEPTLNALLITDRNFLKFVAICNIGEEPSQTRGVLGLGIELTGEKIVKSDPSVLQIITERAVYRTPPQNPRQTLVDAIHYFLYKKADTKAYLVTVRKRFIRELEENNVDLVLLELFYVVFRNTRDNGRQRRQHNIDGCRGIQWFQWSKYKLSEFLRKCINHPDEMLGFITGNNKFVTEVSLDGEIVKTLTIEKMDPAREDAPNPLIMITQFFEERYATGYSNLTQQCNHLAAMIGAEEDVVADDDDGEASAALAGDEISEERQLLSDDEANNSLWEPSLDDASVHEQHAAAGPGAAGPGVPVHVHVRVPGAGPGAVPGVDTVPTPPTNGSRGGFNTGGNYGNNDFNNNSVGADDNINADDIIDAASSGGISGISGISGGGGGVSNMTSPSSSLASNKTAILNVKDRSENGPNPDNGSSSSSSLSALSAGANEWNDPLLNIPPLTSIQHPSGVDKTPNRENESEQTWEFDFSSHEQNAVVPGGNLNNRNLADILRIEEEENTDDDDDTSSNDEDESPRLPSRGPCPGHGINDDDGPSNDDESDVDAFPPTWERDRTNRNEQENNDDEGPSSVDDAPPSSEDDATPSNEDESDENRRRNDGSLSQSSVGTGSITETEDDADKTINRYDDDDDDDDDDDENGYGDGLNDGGSDGIWDAPGGGVEESKEEAPNVARDRFEGYIAGLETTIADMQHLLQDEQANRHTDQKQAIATQNRLIREVVSGWIRCHAYRVQANATQSAAAADTNLSAGLSSTTRTGTASSSATSSATSTSTGTVVEAEAATAVSPTQEVSRSTAETPPGDKSHDVITTPAAASDSRLCAANVGRHGDMTYNDTEEDNNNHGGNGGGANSYSDPVFNTNNDDNFPSTATRDDDTNSNGKEPSSNKEDDDENSTTTDSITTQVADTDALPGAVAPTVRSFTSIPIPVSAPDQDPEANAVPFNPTNSNNDGIGGGGEGVAKVVSDDVIDTAVETEIETGGEENSEDDEDNNVPSTNPSVAAIPVHVPVTVSDQQQPQQHANNNNDPYNNPTIEANEDAVFEAPQTELEEVFDSAIEGMGKIIKNHTNTDDDDDDDDDDSLASLGVGSLLDGLERRRRSASSSGGGGGESTGANTIESQSSSPRVEAGLSERDVQHPNMSTAHATTKAALEAKLEELQVQYDALMEEFKDAQLNDGIVHQGIRDDLEVTTAEILAANQELESMRTDRDFDRDEALAASLAANQVLEREEELRREAK